jgi:hypothetical protein
MKMRACFLSPSVAHGIAVMCAALFVATAPTAQAGTFNAQPGPWQRTEVRTPCADFNVTRNAYFGDTHVHGPEGIRFYTRAKAITSRWPGNEYQEHHRTHMHFPTAT